jgi:hypothetical protein
MSLWAPRAFALRACYLASPHRLHAPVILSDMRPDALPPNVLKAMSKQLAAGDPVFAEAQLSGCEGSTVMGWNGRRAAVCFGME